MAVGSVQHLTNGAYGFGLAKVRRIKPVALACIHITGNSRTAADADLHGAAQDERNYANRADSRGPSAHDYVARDGWAIEAVDWKRYAAWSNGDVSSPNTDNPGIRRVLAMRAKGYNANEAYWLEFENVGHGSSYPITNAQKQHDAERIAAASAYSDLPINRETVHGHWEINGVDRQNCPSPAHESFLNDVIARARAIAGDEDDMALNWYPIPRPTGPLTIKTERPNLVNLVTGKWEKTTDLVKTSLGGVHLAEPWGGDPAMQDGYLVRHRQQAWVALDGVVATPPESPSTPAPGPHSHKVSVDVDGQKVEGSVTFA